MTDNPRGLAAELPAVRSGVRESHRIGIVQDWGIGLRPLYDQYDATLLALEEAHASGLIDRPVELEVLELEGLPYARATTLLGAVERFVERFEPIALIGPHTSDNLPVVKPWAERQGIPIVAMSAALDVAGPWTFLTPNGTFADEAVLLVDHLADVLEVERIGLLREDNVLGDEYAGFFKAHVHRRGLRMVADLVIPTFSDAEAGLSALSTVRDAGAEAYAYVGFGATAVHVLAASQVLAADGYDVPRVTTSIFMGTIEGLTDLTATQYGGLLRNYEGWTGIDQFDEHNPHYAALRDRFAERFGRRADHCYLAQGYDMGNAVAHGLAGARPCDRDGLRRGLERVRRVPAAAGHPGTHISFGPYDHRGYKGDYIVLRKIENGRNVLAPRRAEPPR